MSTSSTSPNSASPATPQPDSAHPRPKRPKKNTTALGKRGGQLGNTNALRHGFYSKSFTLSEMSALDANVKGEFHDELSVCRVNAARLAELMQDYKNMSPKDFIAASNALNNYLDHIRSLTRDQRFIYQNQTTIEKALEELQHLFPSED